MLRPCHTRLSRLLCTSIALLLSFSCAASGGGSEDVTVSVSRLQPEAAALDGFLHGHLGILWPSYDRAFLMMAYRQSSGLKPLSDEDAARYIKQAAVSPNNPPSSQPIDALDSWTAARQQLGMPPLPYRISTGWRQLPNYSSVDNCQRSAFSTAVATLARRTLDHGNEPAALKQWLAAQDSVFSACDTGIPSVPMPPLAKEAPLWLAKDYAYQNAAALLYQSNFDAAGKAFEKIARDQASPWQAWADYLVVRTWWRSSFLDSKDYTTFVDATPNWQRHAMITRLQRLAAYQAQPEVAAAAQGLYNALSTRFAPKSVHQSRWADMAAATPVASLDDWLADIRFLWAVLKADDYQDDWLYDTRSLWSLWDDNSNQQAALDTVIAQWKINRQPIWLASVLMAATPATPAVDDLINASRNVKAGEPLYLHFAWHRVRLALAQHQLAQARQELAAARPNLISASLGTRQAFDQLEMLAAPTLDTLAQHLVRKTISVDNFDYDGYSTSRSIAADKQVDFLDAETRHWLSHQLDGASLLALAQNSRLPTAIRRDIAGEAWRWGAMLPDAKLEIAAVKLLANLTQDDALAAAATNPNPAAMRFLMARALLLKEQPRLAHSGENMDALGFDKPKDLAEKQFNHWDNAAVFYDDATRQAQRDALTQLATRNDTTWMGEQILPWIREQPKFAEGPAILEKLVYASRYGMQDTATSRQAFQLLHKKYAGSPEAIRTRYFY